MNLLRHICRGTHLLTGKLSKNNLNIVRLGYFFASQPIFVICFCYLALATNWLLVFIKTPNSDSDKKFNLIQASYQTRVEADRKSLCHGEIAQPAGQRRTKMK